MSEDLPPPLPPERRTVGQLIGESLKLYRQRFFYCLALGLGPGATGVVLASASDWSGRAFIATAGAVLFTVSFMLATRVVAQVELDRRSATVALVGGVLAFVPFPFLAWFAVLPGVAWLAFVGLVVPVALIERRGLRASFARAVALARADYLHALGSVAALTLVTLASAFALYVLLLGFGEALVEVAAFLSVLVISPVAFLGSALLYFDQAARL